MSPAHRVIDPGNLECARCHRPLRLATREPTPSRGKVLTVVRRWPDGMICSGCAATAQENWDAHCAKCHAADGTGSTKIGTKLKLKDYSKAEAQAAFTDAEALAAIKDGVKDAAGKFTMNPYGEKLTAEEMQALVPFVRALKK